MADTFTTAIKVIQTEYDRLKQDIKTLENTIKAVEEREDGDDEL